MAGKLTVNEIVLGDSSTPSQNFLLKTNQDGTATLARNADGSGGNILTVDSQNNVVFNVLNNTGVLTDIALPIGATAAIDATLATSIPLRIATNTDQIYQILMFGTYTPAAASTNTYLQINNTNYAPGQFTLRQIVSSNNTPSAANTAEPQSSGFRLESVGSSVYSVDAMIFTKTTAKRIITRFSSSSSTAGSSGTIGVEWTDVTTPWTSLGTIILPNAWTGKVVIKRIL